MVFSSSVFLFAFLPIVLSIYFILRTRRSRNISLLLASLFFYAWGEPVYIALMIFSISINYVLAMLIAKENTKSKQSKHLLIFAVIINILVIGFFKYEGFLANNINLLLGTTIIPNLDLPLPIGISFYTLQVLSYVIDVYRKEVPAQRNILYLGMYVACFPQLIAGPIVRYQTIQDQVENRVECANDFASGLRLFIVGLAKKVLLANNVAILANQMLQMGGESIGFIGAWGGLIAYSFQIYFDFSGYSDMAIGLGRMMGFKYLRNFNYPYIAKSITEFWRRWHISLSTFFRDYVYIPLGGSRVARWRHILNIAIVWTITGLWHGAAWNYVLWGLYYGVLLILEKYVFGNALEKAPALLRHVYVIFIFVFGWSFFWITDSSQLLSYYQAMIGTYGLLGTSTFWELTVWQYWPIFILCIAASVPIAPFLKERLTAWIEGRKPDSIILSGIANARTIESGDLCEFSAVPATRGKKAATVVFSLAYDLALLALLALSGFSIIAGSFNPFIYFQF